MVATFAAAFFLLRYTRFGTHVFGVGGDEGAARLSRRARLRVKIWLYVLSALSAGVAGIVRRRPSGSVAPYAASDSNDLLSILAAVIIGGTALTGGRGSVIGTLVGILLLGHDRQRPRAREHLELLPAGRDRRDPADRDRPRRDAPARSSGAR